MRRRRHRLPSPLLMPLCSGQVARPAAGAQSPRAAGQSATAPRRRHASAGRLLRHSGMRLSAVPVSMPVPCPCPCHVPRRLYRRLSPAAARRRRAAAERRRSEANLPRHQTSPIHACPLLLPTDSYFLHRLLFILITCYCPVRDERFFCTLPSVDYTARYRRLTREEAPSFRLPLLPHNHRIKKGKLNIEQIYQHSSASSNCPSSSSSSSSRCAIVGATNTLSRCCSTLACSAPSATSSSS